MVLRNIDCCTKLSDVKKALVKKLGSDIAKCCLWQADDDDISGSKDTPLKEENTLAEEGIVQNAILYLAHGGNAGQ